MAKRSKRPGRTAPDIHATIRADALTLMAAPTAGASDARAWPEIEALLNAARNAIGAAVPASFTFEGRTYWIRASMAIQLAIFAGPADGKPLVEGVSLTSDEYGHAPRH